MMVFITNRTIQKIFITAAWILIWQMAYLYINKEVLIVSPFDVFMRLLQLVITTDFWRNSFASIFRILSGFLLALIFGSAFAVMSNASAMFNAFFSPFISVIKATPVASFILLVFLWLGSANVPLFISFLIVFPVAFGNMIYGIRTVDIKLLQMSNIYKFSLFKKIKYIYVPTVVPHFMAAATTGLGLAWKAGIAAEVLSIPKFGIGSKLYKSKVYLDIIDLFAWTVFIILFSMLIEFVLVRFINYIGQRAGKDRKNTRNGRNFKLRHV